MQNYDKITLLGKRYPFLVNGAEHVQCEPCPEAFSIIESSVMHWRGTSLRFSPEYDGVEMRKYREVGSESDRKQSIVDLPL